MKDEIHEPVFVTAIEDCYPEDSLVAFVGKLQAALDQVPEQYRSGVKLQDSWDPNVFNYGYYRPPTEAEIAERKEARERSLRDKEQRALRILESVRRQREQQAKGKQS